MNIRRRDIIQHRNVALVPLIGIMSCLAFGPNSTMIPVVAVLSLLLLYAPIGFREDDHPKQNALILTCVMGAGGALSRYGASKNALSIPIQSMVTLYGLSTVAAALVTATLYVTTKLRTRFTSQWAQILIFPSAWATLWTTVAYLSPVGYLSTWSVVSVPDAYRWLIPIFGPAIKDWIAATWAVILSELLASWYMGEQRESLLDVDEEDYPDVHSSSRILAIALVMLTVPSFFSNPLPLPTSFDSLDFSTPVGVGCVNPTFQTSKHHIPTLEDFIHEIRILQPQAKVLLLPEGALRFDSTTERDNAFAKIRAVLQGPYVGVSFEETVPDPQDPKGRKPMTRTGVAVISQYSDEPHMVYYKRHLVPFAESFSLRHSTLPPTVFDVPLKAPNHVSDGKWSSRQKGPRPLPITSSICLDMATPSPFSELESRPSLILAPARTWDRTVGYSMWLQAKQRAEELGSILLWCDGGEGGVSGVAGPGLNDVAQIGTGSFVRTIGVEYPFNTRRTSYATFGSIFLIFAWLPVIMQSRSASGAGRIGHGIRNLIAVVTRRPANSQVETPTNLLD